MTNALPPLTWFRAFEVAARHLSFTAAATELNVTQSAVSQHVRALEQRFGVQLFERQARGLTLSEAGRRLLPYVSGAVEELSKATKMFLSQSEGEQLEILCTTSFAILWLLPRLKDFRATAPGATIRVSSTLWPDENLKEKSDLQIRFGNRALFGTRAMPIGDKEIVPICKPDQAKAIRKLEDFWQLPLIHTVGGAYDWDAWARHLRLPPPPPAQQIVDSMVLAKCLAEAGSGVALASRFLCCQALQDGEIAVPLDRGYPANDQFFLTLSDFAERKPLAKAFRDWLMSEITASGKN